MTENIEEIKKLGDQIKSLNKSIAAHSRDAAETMQNICELDAIRDRKIVELERILTSEFSREKALELIALTSE